MTDLTQGSLKGHFLMAMPGLMDPNFHQTVTCITEHTEAGAVGIVINRIHSLLSGKDIFEELNVRYSPGKGRTPIHIGGPVHLGEVFILHGPPFGWQGCFMVTPTLGMSNTRDLLEAIAMDKGPESYLISLGCAGWGRDQLETEIKSNAWLTNALSEDIIFNTPADQRWEAAMRMVGVDPLLLSGSAGHA
ncbi:MAG: YqgE/AlgH family protein [Desulfobacterales bacterium]|nr:YqgE/AlgH family protein [Desulfobacterales bacterium]